MKRVLVFTLCMAIGFSAMADEKRIFSAKLGGFAETPAILTKGGGTFNSTLDVTGTMLSYTLTFNNLSSNTTVAHIHMGQRGGAGAAIVFLCGGGNKPACPLSGGTISGTILAADVLAAPTQGITAGNFSDLLAVLRNEVAYVNVHSVKYPAGEIRGQISADDSEV